MKRVFSFLLAAVLLFGVYSISAFADGGTITVMDAAEPVEPGESFTMDVVISDNPGFAAMILDLDYDHSALQLCAAEGIIAYGTWEINDVRQNDVIVWYDGINFTVNGPIVRLYFKVFDTTPAGEYYVSLKRPVDDWRGLFNDTDNCPMTFNYVSGKVIVKGAEEPILYGDVNNDGVINGKDAILLNQYLADWDVEINLEAADVVPDGVVNGKDAILLNQYLADWDVTLGKA
jgi:hypothetical protein